MDKEHSHKTRKSHASRDIKYEDHGSHKIHVVSHHAEHAKKFLKKFIVSSLLTILMVLFIISDTSVKWYAVLILSTSIFIYGGQPFIEGMINEIRKKLPGMMTLISIALISAYAYSSYSVFVKPDAAFFIELAIFIDIMLIGHFIEAKASLKASEAVQKLISLLPKTAHKIEENDEIKDVDINSIKVGDLILVKPGERIPVDGIVVKGSSEIDVSLLTGEAVPIKVGKGDGVIGGSLNLLGSIMIKALRVGEEMYLSQVVNLLRRVQMSKTRIQTIADKAAMVLTFLTIGIAISAFFIWILNGADLGFAMERLISVLVVACPHALGLGVPIVVAITSSKGAEMGLLIRNRAPFEQAWRVTTIVFDKTGTLTEGRFRVSRVISLSDLPEEEILRLAASIESYSEHPIAQGIVDEAKERGINLIDVKDFKALPGKGVKAIINNNEVLIVGKNYLKELDIEAPELEFSGSIVYVVVDKKLLGAIILDDRIRAEAYEAVRRLKEIGKEIILLTGDSKESAERVAKALGIEKYFAEVLPHQKVEVVEELKKSSRTVMMVGDGINDAPALVASDIGVAIGAGADVTIESADVILVRNDPRDIPKLIDLSKKSYRKMIENILWASWYNAIIIPSAAGAFYYLGFVISPALGAILMTLSDVIVVLNALRMR